MNDHMQVCVQKDPEATSRSRFLTVNRIIIMPPHEVCEGLK